MTRVLSLDLGTKTGWAMNWNGQDISGSASFTRYAGSKKRKADHHGIAATDLRGVWI